MLERKIIFEVWIRYIALLDLQILFQDVNDKQETVKEACHKEVSVSKVQQTDEEKRMTENILDLIEIRRNSKITNDDTNKEVTGCTEKKKWF